MLLNLLKSTYAKTSIVSLVRISKKKKKKVRFKAKKIPLRASQENFLRFSGVIYKTEILDVLSRSVSLLSKKNRV